MEFLSGYLWKKGTAADINEDSLTVQQIHCKGKLCLMAMVCDGIGGLEKGEYASGYVTEEMVKWFYNYIPKICVQRRSSHYIKKAILREFHRIHMGLKEAANKNKCRMGTTVTFLLIISKKAYLFHLGDSRLYRITSKGEGKRITEIHENNRMLTKALSSFAYQVPDSYSFRIRRREGYLLCSDGLWKFLKNEQIRESFRTKELYDEDKIWRRLKELWNMVVRMGGKDDISAIYIQTK